MAQSFTVSITDDLWTECQTELKNLATDNKEEALTVARMNTYLSEVVSSRLNMAIQKKKLQEFRKTLE
tara:strand:- start:1069 stop:1272 length:204 start_codon:yes stop_codon:yes gene_type:complete